MDIIQVIIISVIAAAIGFCIAWLISSKNIKRQKSTIDRLKFRIGEHERSNISLKKLNNKLQEKNTDLSEKQQSSLLEKTTIEKLLDRTNKEKNDIKLLLENNKQEHLVQNEKQDALAEQLFASSQEKQALREEILQLKQDATVLEERNTQKVTEELVERFRVRYKEKKKEWEDKNRDIYTKYLEIKRERDNLLKSEQVKKVKSIGGNLPFDPISIDHVHNIPSAIRVKDDLKVIEGIDALKEEKLNELGFYKYEHLADLDHQDIELLNKALILSSDYISEYDWVSQAKKLK